MPRSRPTRSSKTRSRGAQRRNSNAKTHGFYSSLPPRKLDTITDILLDAQARQAQLSTYIDAVLAEGATTDDVVKLIGLHAQGATRLARLLRDQRALGGQAAEGLTAAIAAALDELGTEIGLPEPP
jgi:hypothetical protein